MSATALLGASAAHAGLVFSGNPNPAITVIPEKNTGLEAVYVLDGLSGVTVSFESNSDNVTVLSFGSAGGGYAQPVPGLSRNGKVWSFSPAVADRGYIIDADNTRKCYWITDYPTYHAMQLQDVRIADADCDCNRTSLEITGTAKPITYFSINGRAVELSRDIRIVWQTLAFDSESRNWRQGETSVTLPSMGVLTALQAPLCNTSFTVSGDRFLEQWGRGLSVTSPEYDTPAVSAQTFAEQQARDADNEKKTETDGLGGSAPCVITFTAVPTDAAVFKEWQISRVETFEDIAERYNQDEVTLTFNDRGTHYVRYVCADATGACMFESDVYPVTVGQARLEIPNAFSPGNQDGINDIWKVSYSSIVSFECHIFNRWGTKMATLTSPSQGWDGRYGGKIVSSGVYFYVIKAVGADGIKYNKSGDINVLNSRRGQSTVTE